MAYRDLRTGLRYVDVHRSMHDCSPNPADWKRKTRHTVLGRWHQLKLHLWDAHVRDCVDEERDDAREPSYSLEVWGDCAPF